MSRHTVCLCFDYEKCLADTKQLAEQNGALDFEVVTVDAPVSWGYRPAYKGVLIMPDKEVAT